jgi:hypothetical protein
MNLFPVIEVFQLASQIFLNGEKRHGSGNSLQLSADAVAPTP